MIRKYQRYRRGRRWLVGLALAGCVAFHAGVIARFLLSPAQFRARTRLFLQRQFGGEVEVGRAGYEFPAGFRLNALAVSRPAERGGGEMFRAKALSVDLALLALLRGKVAVEELVLEEPEVHLRKEDVAELAKARPAEPAAPVGRIVIRGGRVVLGRDTFFEGSPERELRDVRIELAREHSLRAGYSFEGEANSALWGRCTLEGTADLGGRRLDGKVQARGIAIDARLRELLPKEYGKYARVIDAYDLKGEVDLSLEASVGWGEGGALTLRAVADLRDCSAAWERFPVRCTDIRGKVVYDGTNIYYQDLTGRAGQATVTLSGRTTREKVEVHLTARGRPLDDEVRKAAWPALRALWERCGIEGGVVNLDYQSTYWRADGRYEATVRTEVRDGRATYQPFPYPLSDIAGSVRWENGVSHIEGLRGRRGQARVEIRGQVTDAGVPTLTIEAFDLPFDDTLHKALTAEWKKTYEELRPQGTAAVQCSVTSPSGSAENFHYRFLIRPEGASFQHKDFPHRITDVRGDILVDEAGTVSFRDLRGRLGAIPLQFLGTVRPGPRGPVLDIAVVAEKVELSPAVKAYLPPEACAVYDALDPRGKVSFTWRLTTDPATGAPRRSSEAVCLQDCSVQHKLFPVRITGLMGRVAVDEEGRTTFTGMKGRLGNAVVEAVAGECAPGGLGALSFTIRASALDLNDAIRNAIPESWRKVWDDVRPSGEAAVEYQYTGNPKEPEKPEQRVTVEPSDGAFCYRRFPLPVNEVTRGKVVFHQDGSATINNLQGKVRGKAVTLSGKVAVGPEGPVLHLDAAADELVLDDELRRALPPEWQEMWDSLRLGGKIGATATGSIKMGKADWESFRLNATLRGCEATWRALPVRLTGLRGRAEYADGQVTLIDVVGECAVAEQVELNGRVPRKGVPGGRLQISAQNVRLVPEFFAALPPEVKKAAEALELRGSADAKLTVSPAAGASDATDCFGEVRLRECSFRRTHQFQQVSGNIRVDKGVICDDGRHSLEGGLDLRKMVVGKAKLVLTEIRGAYAYTRTPATKDKAVAQPPQAVESRLVLSDVTSSFYGGRLDARVELDLGGTGAFAARMNLSGADFKVFCKEALGSDAPVTGRLNVRLEFPPGTLKGEKGLVGDGNASLERGDLGQLPLAAAVLNAFSLRSPLDRSITDATATFGIASDHLVLKQLELSGQERVLAGQGTVGFDGSLNLQLTTPQAGRSLLDVVRFVPNLIRESLVQVDARGTLSQPDFRVVGVPAMGQLVEVFTGAVGLWRKRHPEKPGAPEAPKEP